MEYVDNFVEYNFDLQKIDKESEICIKLTNLIQYLNHAVYTLLGEVSYDYNANYFRKVIKEKGEKIEISEFFNLKFLK